MKRTGIVRFGLLVLPPFSMIAACQGSQSGVNMAGADAGADAGATADAGAATDAGTAAADAGNVKGIVYLNFTSHNEEQSIGEPDYVNASTYTTYREYYRQIAETMSAKGAKWNMQTDWRFVAGVIKNDVGTVNTNNKNILRWMVEDKDGGIVIDPHAHETTYNYADVVTLLGDAGVTATKTVGGFVYDTTPWQAYQAGLNGSIFPTASWAADLLWGAASTGHVNDDNSYGVWRPQSAANFYTDDSSKIPYVGSGCKNVIDAGSTAAAVVMGVTRIVDGIADGGYTKDGFYTATIMFNTRELTSNIVSVIGQTIDGLAGVVDAGKVVWAHIGEKRALWLSGYDAGPFRLACP